MEWAKDETSAWADFLPKLEALTTTAGALSLVAEATRPDTPGRGYYSNLGFFLQEFAPPDGASTTELAQYIHFLERLDASGELKPGAKRRLIDRLQRAVDAKQ